MGHRRRVQMVPPLLVRVGTRHAGRRRARAAEARLLRRRVDGRQRAGLGPRRVCVVRRGAAHVRPGAGRDVALARAVGAGLARVRGPGARLDPLRRVRARSRAAQRRPPARPAAHAPIPAVLGGAEGIWHARLAAALGERRDGLPGLLPAGGPHRGMLVLPARAGPELCGQHLGRAPRDQSRRRAAAGALPQESVVGLYDDLDGRLRGRLPRLAARDDFYDRRGRGQPGPDVLHRREYLHHVSARGGGRRLSARSNRTDQVPPGERRGADGAQKARGLQGARLPDDRHDARFGRLPGGGADAGAVRGALVADARHDAPLRGRGLARAAGGARTRDGGALYGGHGHLRRRRRADGRLPAPRGRRVRCGRGRSRRHAQAGRSFVLRGVLRRGAAALDARRRDDRFGGGVARGSVPRRSRRFDHSAPQLAARRERLRPPRARPRRAQARG